MIRDNLSRIKERIQAVCSKINRQPDQITIIAVSKSRTADEIKEAVEAGLTGIGENKVQEASLKYKLLSASGLGPSTIKWHMIGHLQTNKAKEAVRIFDLIHSVDSLRLAREIDKQAAKINKIQEVLIEINTSGEEAKYGLSPRGSIEIIKEVARLENIRVKGLMTVAPVVEAPDKTRPYFRSLKELLEEINALRVTPEAIRILSMGMTDDFETAVEEGANMLRLGRAIFEKK
ncbi:MAG: YggS family pyridoxal phosphate-dependent enzyme [Candidatus Omnitrophica bacterium]|nr:YggS family pyridoxal phosphate-dependent enzyme [Candidatus Omnitrophota bacterium]